MRRSTVVLGCLLGLSCSKKSERVEPPAEVEISGSLASEVKGRVDVFVDKARCDPSRTEFTPLGVVSEDPAVTQRYFLEVFVPQGSTGHLCAAAFDAEGKMVGFAASEKNPLTFAGKGEVEHHLALKVKALPTPLPHPRGLP